MRHLPLRILDELETGRSSRRHELCLRLGKEWKLGFIEALDEQHVSCDADHSLALLSKLVHASVRCKQLRAESYTAIARHVRPIALVLADLFKKVGVPRQQPFCFRLKWPGERLRIGDRDFEIHMAEVAPPAPFRDAKGFRLRVSSTVEPGFVVESRARHNQRVSVPSAD